MKYVFSLLLIAISAFAHSQTITPEQAKDSIDKKSNYLWSCNRNIYNRCKWCNILKHGW